MGNKFMRKMVTLILAAAMVMKNIKDFKKKVDYSEYGGAPLLGTAKPVIKAHGSSDEKAFYNALNKAVKDVRGEKASSLFVETFSRATKKLVEEKLKM